MLAKNALIGLVATLMLAGCMTSISEINSPTPVPEAALNEGGNDDERAEESLAHEEIINDEFNNSGEEMIESDGSDGDEKDTSGIHRELTIEMYNHGYSRETIRARAGETWDITLLGMEGSHNLVIDELNVISETIGEEEETVVTIEMPTDPAEDGYIYYCSVADHRELGMEGRLIVR
jgi:plastocyanin